VNAALLEASAVPSVYQDSRTRSVLKHKLYPFLNIGATLYSGDSPVAAGLWHSQSSVQSHRTNHESHRIPVMAFKPYIVGCLWRSCICFRDLF